ncbi:MAG: Serine/threonine protein kinase PrkC, regulator of stationary phase [Ktedonobacterales bacterium]|jgi:serine/threonine-protein kinase|nr:MAG: Serine/threonine protein kinase PrkC, regulator of stationary phase [Ktedonobacterales bacterium]
MELEVLGDRYELHEPIGRGGMATIYRAVDLRMGRTVAVKILREVYSSDPKFVTRFQREARASSALQHPNIVQVFDYGQSGSSYYIVMEFVDGTDLRRYLKKQQGVLSNERAIEIAHDVALGLGAAHKRGIVHRDVKPQNVMLNDAGLVKLTDFGIASMYKDAEAERLTTTGMTLGTVQYYAPEQAQGEIVSPAADIYALGIVMYEMLTGKTPFDGDTPVAVAMRHIQDDPEPPSMLNSRISPALEQVILKCLKKDPRNRYRDGDSLAFALENLGRGAPDGRRGTTGARTGGPRAQFGPLGLPSGDPRQLGGPGGGGYSGGDYGAPAMASGPARGGASGRVMSGPRSGPGNMAGGGWDEPTYEGFGPTGFGPQAGIGTRPYGPAPGTMPRTGTPSNPYGAPSGPAKPRKNGPLVAVVVASAVLLLGLACALIANMTGVTSALFASPTPSATVAMTTVPNFIGMSFEQAQTAATNAHLLVTAQYVNADKTHPVDTVTAQDPPAGAAEPYKATVTLTVTKSPDKILIPNVNNMPVTQAIHTLQTAGFTNITTVNQLDMTVPASSVIKSDPQAGSYALPGDKITLYVSLGSPTPSPTATQSVTPTPTDTATPTPTCAPGTPTPPAC